jgi:hypothetical protein
LFSVSTCLLVFRVYLSTLFTLFTLPLHFIIPI